MNITRNELSHLIQTGIIPPEKVEQALATTKLAPTHTEWKNFLGNTLLWLGALALCSSALFFIAYNWDEMGRFAKFGLVEILLILSIALYWWSSKKASSAPDTPPLLHKVSLLMGSIFLGVLLAFYGQTYQTGADTWQLFAMWCLLMLPWAIISRFAALWMLWLALLNTAIVLYFQAHTDLFSMIFDSNSSMLWLVAGVNAVALLIWELLETRWKWLSANWATRLIALASGIPITFLVIYSIFDEQSNFIPALAWLVGLALIYFVYRKRKPDLFMLAMACLSGISVILSLSGNFIFSNTADIAGFFVQAILVIVLGSMSAVWLKGIHKEQLLAEGDEL